MDTTIFCKQCGNQIKKVDAERFDRSRYRFHIGKSNDYKMFSLCRKCFNDLLPKFEKMSSRDDSEILVRRGCNNCTKTPLPVNYVFCKNDGGYGNQQCLVLCKECLLKLCPEILVVLI